MKGRQPRTSASGARDGAESTEVEREHRQPAFLGESHDGRIGETKVEVDGHDPVTVPIAG